VLGGPATPVEGELAQLRRLGVASMVEGATLAALVGVAVPLKHLAAWPLAVTVMGPSQSWGRCTSWRS